MSAGHRPIFNFQFSIFNLMKRQHLQDPVFKFEDTAIVLLQTDYLNYQFIYALNQACRLEMERIDDIELADGAHPCFLYFNEVSRLTYVVLDVPIPPYNMMLLIRGRDAWDIQESLYKSLTEEVREPDPTDIRDHLDWELSTLSVSPLPVARVHRSSSAPPPRPCAPARPSSTGSGNSRKSSSKHWSGICARIN